MGRSRRHSKCVSRTRMGRRTLLSLNLRRTFLRWPTPRPFPPARARAIGSPQLSTHIYCYFRAHVHLTEVRRVSDVRSLTLSQSFIDICHKLIIFRVPSIGNACLHGDKLRTSSFPPLPYLHPPSPLSLATVKYPIVCYPRSLARSDNISVASS